MKFRKIARIIDAVQFDGTPAGAVAVFEEFDIPGGKFVPGYDLRTGVLAIPTLEGDMRADRGDWIIKGVQGEFYPCKPSIFAETYEEESVAAEPQRWRDVKVEGNPKESGEYIAAFPRLREIARKLCLNLILETGAQAEEIALAVLRSELMGLLEPCFRLDNQKSILEEDDAIHDIRAELEAKWKR